MLVVLGRARRRREDVLGAAEVRLIEVMLVDEEVLGAGLAPGAPARRPGGRERLDRLAAGDVNDVQGAARDVGQRDRAARGLALGEGWPRRRVPARLGLAL